MSSARSADAKRLTGLRVRPGQRYKLRDALADRDLGLEREVAERTTAEIKLRLGELQYQMYAEGRHSLLVVLQAIDGGGKDSTIRHVFSAFNPQGCTVTSFKAPSAEELRHDYLWRIHRHAPPRGEVAVFNRSHYEDVLVVRVDRLAPEPAWKARYKQINDFEQHLAANGTNVVKIFLHLSRKEQKQRFAERLADPAKHWKFDPKDLGKRKQWPAYRAAFEDMLSRCSTQHSPWYVVPADRKWVRDYAVAQILYRTLLSLKLLWPKPAYDPARIRLV